MIINMCYPLRYIHITLVNYYIHIFLVASFRNIFFSTILIGSHDLTLHT